MTELPLADSEIRPNAHIKRHKFVGAFFDHIGLADVLASIERGRNSPGFRYVVTPNVDHVVRLARQPEYARFYEKAWLSLCDSMPIKLAARLKGLDLPRVTGSDLTLQLFKQVIKAGDRLTLVAPSMAVVEELRTQYPALNIRAHVPALGVLNMPEELERCVTFAAVEPADFVFLAIGSPQSEAIAFQLSQDERASGTCLCIGAALEFLTGMKQRAPRWMSNLGLEWLHRLASDPKRMWRRYILSIPTFARLIVQDLTRKDRTRPRV